jgi:hypothetical protein
LSSFDAEWFGDCCNTFHEEQKQLVYAPRMGLRPIWNCGHPPCFDLNYASVVDIGGGPASLLLKSTNLGEALVVDPAPYPPWVKARYKAHGVKLLRETGEAFETKQLFDEAWIYNVLQHVSRPQILLEQARAAARIIRLFEWIDIAPYEGHPQMLTKENLDDWLGSEGFVVDLNENGAVGKAYYGVFADLA